MIFGKANHDAVSLNFALDVSKQNHADACKQERQMAEVVLHDICKYHTSNDVFSRCKSVHKMATGKSDGQSIQSDNKLELGTSYKLILGPR